MSTSTRLWLGRALLTVALVSTLGCAAIADRIVTKLASQGFDLEHEQTLIEGDLASFRTCLSARGGTCEGGVATPLPHAQTTTTTATPAQATGSAALATAVAALPEGDPAKHAYNALDHEVTRSAVDLHNVLRGHQVGEGAGVDVSQSGSTKTVHLGFGIRRLISLHRDLQAAIGTDGFTSLQATCNQQLAAAGSGAARAQITQDCRTIAFVKGYVDAYFRNGQFAALSVDTTGLQNEVTTKVGDASTHLQGDVNDAASGATGAIDQAAQRVEQQTGGTTSATDTAQTGATQAATGTASTVAGTVGSAVESAQSAADQAVTNAAGQVTGAIQQAATEVTTKVTGAIASETQAINTKLSNIVKIQQIGFVSRDGTFQARLPAFDVVLDPTASRLITVTDADTGQQVTGSTQLSQLVGANDSVDTSGVGTASDIGADLVRVFLEAIFDAHEGLPAVAPQNGSPATGLGLGSYSLPTFQSPTGHVDATDLTAMTRINNRVATRARTLLSQVVQGVGPFSLDNASIESFLVEVITTSVRKASEKASWCWYACNLDVDLAQAKQQAEAAAKAVVQQETQTVESRVKSFFQHEVEKVKLALKISS